MLLSILACKYSITNEEQSGYQKGEEVEGGQARRNELEAERAGSKHFIVITYYINSVRQRANGQLSNLGLPDMTSTQKAGGGVKKCLKFAD